MSLNKENNLREIAKVTCRELRKRSKEINESFIK